MVRTWVGNGADKLIQRALDYREAPELFARARPLFDQHYQACLLEGLGCMKGRAEPASPATARLSPGRGDQQAEPLRAAHSGGPRHRDCFALWLGQLRARQEAEPGAAAARLPRAGCQPVPHPDGGGLRNDVLAAQAAGMKVVGLTCGYNYGRPIADSRPDWVCEQFAQLDAPAGRITRINTFMAKPIVLSGAQPSGQLTIGNYMGACVSGSACRMTSTASTASSICTPSPPARIPRPLRKACLDAAALYLAVGIDPAKSTVFIQSHVPQHAELGWI